MFQKHVPRNSEISYFDTGATQHMSPHLHSLIDYQPLPSTIPIYISDNSILKAINFGTITLELYFGHLMDLSHVYHIPLVAQNLLCVVQGTTMAQT